MTAVTKRELERRLNAQHREFMDRLDNLSERVTRLKTQVDQKDMF